MDYSVLKITLDQQQEALLNVPYFKVIVEGGRLCVRKD